MKKELLCSFLFGLWNHFVLFFIMFCSFWFEPRFYIVEFDSFEEENLFLRERDEKVFDISTNFSEISAYGYTKVMV